MRTLSRNGKTKRTSTNGGTKASSTSGQRRAVRKKASLLKRRESTRETVIRLDESVKGLIDKFKTHCIHHWAVELTLITAIIGYIITLIQKI